MSLGQGQGESFRISSAASELADSGSENYEILFIAFPAHRLDRLGSRCARLIKADGRCWHTNPAGPRHSRKQFSATYGDDDDDLQFKRTPLHTIHAD